MSEDKHINIYEQLVDNLCTGKLKMSSVQSAVKTYIKRRTDIPGGIKNLLVNEGGGLVSELFMLLNHTIGSTELAYRRGMAHEMEED